MGIIIRQAKPNDAPAIAIVNIASWHSTYRGLVADEVLDGMEFEQYRAKWENILAHQEKGNGFCFAAENESGEMIGYSCGGKNRHDKFTFDGELFAIYLLREYQGKGIGKKLFLTSIEEFRKQNISSFLLFVLSSNTGSRKFYESFKPDFTANEMITIDNGQYCDICYGWSDIGLINN
jgi:ribosomal protein S18 acetylase RimI-like enzyme